MMPNIENRAPDRLPMQTGLSGPAEGEQNIANGIEPAGQTDLSAQADDQATTEEQQNYEKVVLAGMKILYDKKTNPGIMKMLKEGSDDPAEVVSEITSLVVSQLDQQSGGKLPVIVIIPAAAEIMELVMELGEKADLFKMDEAMQGQAVQGMIMKLVEQFGVEQEEVQALVDSMDDNQKAEIVRQQEGYAGGSSHQAGGPPSMQQPPTAQPQGIINRGAAPLGTG